MTVEFSRRLKSEMNGVSQRELARRSGINHSTISRLLDGERDARADVALGLMKGLGKKTSQVEFLLSAAGHSESVIAEVTGRRTPTLSESPKIIPREVTPLTVRKIPHG